MNSPATQGKQVSSRLRRVWPWLIITAIILILGVNMQLQTKLREPVNAVSVNLLEKYDWSHAVGITKISSGILVVPTNRKIVNQDGSGGQANTPVNLAGPALNYSDTYTIHIGMTGFSGGDSIQLFAGVPIVYDEWRYEPASLKITNITNNLRVDQWDGTSSAPVKTQTLPVSEPLKSIDITYESGGFVVRSGGETLGSISGVHTLNTGRLWFGFESQNTPWSVQNLSVEGDDLSIRNGLNTKKGEQASTLQKEAASSPRPIQIGAAISINPLLTDKQYRELALNQFGIWTPENEMKPQFIHPGPNTYTFQEADLLVQTALKNNIAVHGHALVFGEANPRWMQTTPLANRRKVMTDHISQVMGHYKGQVQDWDVINEPLSDSDMDYANNGNGLRRHIWYQAMGPSYIATALKTAHIADPNAKLYINDYGLEDDGDRWDALIALVEKLKAQGVPLNGIGFEAHVYEDGDHINPAILAEHMQQLASLGLKARISEIDVHGEDAKQQADEYAAVLQTCLQQPNCVAYSTWDITDKYGSTTGTGVYPLSYGNDLLWDTDYRAKLTYQQLLTTLRSSSSSYNR